MFAEGNQEINEIGEAFVSLIQAVLRGEKKLFYTGISWDEAYCGNVEFECDGWKIVVFNDCDSLDYTDCVTTPDGKTADFDVLPTIYDVCCCAEGVDQSALYDAFTTAERKLA